MTPDGHGLSVSKIDVSKKGETIRRPSQNNEIINKELAIKFFTILLKYNRVKRKLKCFWQAIER